MPSSSNLSELVDDHNARSDGIRRYLLKKRPLRLKCIFKRVILVDEFERVQFAQELKEEDVFNASIVDTAKVCRILVL